VLLFECLGEQPTATNTSNQNTSSQSNTALQNHSHNNLLNQSNFSHSICSTNQTSVIQTAQLSRMTHHLKCNRLLVTLSQVRLWSCPILLISNIIDLVILVKGIEYFLINRLSTLSCLALLIKSAQFIC